MDYTQRRTGWSRAGFRYLPGSSVPTTISAGVALKNEWPIFGLRRPDSAASAAHQTEPAASDLDGAEISLDHVLILTAGLIVLPDSSHHSTSAASHCTAKIIELANQHHLAAGYGRPFS